MEASNPTVLERLEGCRREGLKGRAEGSLKRGENDERRRRERIDCKQEEVRKPQDRANSMRCEALAGRKERVQTPASARRSSGGVASSAHYPEGAMESRSPRQSIRPGSLPLSGSVLSSKRAHRMKEDGNDVMPHLTCSMMKKVQSPLK
jgi:hypothetical protein